MARFGTNPDLRNREYPTRVYESHLLPRGDPRMTRHDQELLAKQLWAVSTSPRQNNTTIMGLIIVAVFLVGIGVGDVLSKTKEANTHYAALISYPK